MTILICYFAFVLFSDAVNGYKIPASPRKEIDVFIPALNIGIEYDGEYWHKDPKRDEEKNRIIHDSGIKLIRIREQNCPALNDNLSYIIPVDASGDVEKHLETAIQELFNYIGGKSNVRTNFPINLKKDTLDILAEFENDKKADSVYANDVLSKDWNYEKNGKLQPHQVHSGSKRKVWWKCSTCGYEWKSIVFDRARGIGCPACSGKVVQKGLNDLLSQRPDIAAEWNYEKNGILKPDQVHLGSNLDVWWKCSNCGSEWQAKVISRKMSNCPKCNYQRVAANRHLIKGENDLATRFPELIRDWNYEKNTIDPSSITSGSHQKVHWKCHKCGYEWYGNVYDRTNSHGCPQCAKDLKSKKLGRRNLVVGKTDLATKYPEIALDWDYEKNEMTPNEVSYGSSKKVYWVCSKCGHRWEATISNRTNRKSKCPRCHGKQ